VLEAPTTQTVDLSIYKDAVDKDIGLHIRKALALSDFDSWPDDVRSMQRNF